ncbi:MAG: trypsin-like peptidase domain-containing protein [Planctomycetia bacterium]|nr:trypsin-like peptidase domain-containing protein [Planctomycetia bacterium]
MKIRHLNLCILCVILSCVIAPLSHAAEAEKLDATSAHVFMSIQKAAEKATSAVVEVMHDESFFPSSNGSGVIISADGWILTNAHVLKGKERVYVETEEGILYESKSIHYDSVSDIGVIKIDAKKPLPFLDFGSSDDLKLGESVLSVGSPFSLGTSVSYGIVSAKYRAHPGAHRRDMIQTDALINPGNSGGALVNLKGELVGITTSRYAKRDTPQGIGFSIPSSVARWVYEQLKEKGKVERKHVGLEITNVNVSELKRRNLPLKFAFRVTQVKKGSPAEKAGIKQNDLILETCIEGKTELFPDLEERIPRLPDGEKVIFKIHRAGTPGDTVQTFEVPVETNHDFQERPEHEHLQPVLEGQNLMISDIGMTLKIDTESKPQVTITEVIPGSVADDCELKPGMNIILWGGMEFKNLEPLVGAISTTCITCGKILVISENGHIKSFLLRKYNMNI